MLLGLHFIYLLTPTLKADAHHSKGFGEGKGKKSAACGLFLQGFWLSLSRGTRPIEGQERAKGNKILPLPRSEKSRCSHPASEVGKGIPDAGVYFIEAEKDAQISQLLF